MLIIKLALRTIARRKGRMALIGSLVAFGSFLIVFGSVFAASAKAVSKASIIDNFTGDLLVYSARSKDLPSPFAFNSPLPLIRNEGKVEAALAAMPEVEAFAPYAQNLGVLQAERGGKRIDLPFIFYAVAPESYLRVFRGVGSWKGGFFGLRGPGGPGDRAGRGVMISAFQNAAYAKNYGVTLSPGEEVTLLGVTEGGVNTLRSKLVGIFEPNRYSGVFNYVNFIDDRTYASLFDYSGVAALPPSFDASLAAAGNDEAAIFGLADAEGITGLDVSKLKAEALSGATMIAVHLKDHGAADSAIARLAADPALGVKAARWDAASGFYAQVASGLQALIYLATGLVFLVVALIFMNTLIINVTERTAEIGTMRALGAEKSFIRGLFLAEALALNLVSALAGMAAAAVAVAASGERGIALPEMVSQFLIGGGGLRLTATAGPFGLALAVVAVVSVLATLYPIRVATSIAPIKAMSDR
jgi:putative ABC transport system permease protein